MPNGFAIGAYKMTISLDEQNNRVWFNASPRLPWVRKPLMLDVILNLSLFFMTQV